MDPIMLFGLPLVLYLGLVTITLVIITLVVGASIHRGNSRFTIRGHRLLAIISLLVALVHGLAGLLYYL